MTTAAIRPWGSAPVRPIPHKAGRFIIDETPGFNPSGDGEHGAPNYFGEQRFVREGRNSERATEFFQGCKISRKQQGMPISAARSQVFINVLAQRVAPTDGQRPPSIAFAAHNPL